MKTSITPPKKNKLKVKNTFIFTARIFIYRLLPKKSYKGEIMERGKVIATIYGKNQKQVQERTAKMIAGLATHHAIIIK